MSRTANPRAIARQPGHSISRPKTGNSAPHTAACVFKALALPHSVERALKLASIRHGMRHAVVRDAAGGRRLHETFQGVLLFKTLTTNVRHPAAQRLCCYAAVSPHRLTAYLTASLAILP